MSTYFFLGKTKESFEKGDFRGIGVSAYTCPVVTRQRVELVVQNGQEDRVVETEVVHWRTEGFNYPVTCIYLCPVDVSCYPEVKRVKRIISTLFTLEQEVGTNAIINQ